MIQCDRYHGDVYDVLSGFHGFNIFMKTNESYIRMTYEERKTLLNETLPAVDHSHLVATELIETYRRVRRENLTRLFYCSRALYRHLFASHGRKSVLAFPRGQMQEMIRVGTKRHRWFKMLLLMTASESKTKREISLHVSTSTKDLSLDDYALCKGISEVYEMLKAFELYAKTHEVLNPSHDHGVPSWNRRLSSHVRREIWPDDTGLAKLAFKYFVTNARVAEFKEK